MRKYLLYDSPVGDSEHCAVIENVSHRRLDQLIGVVVDCGGSFVHHNDTAVAQQGTSQTEELPLADGEVVPVLHNRGLENAVETGGGKGEI